MPLHCLNRRLRNFGPISLIIIFLGLAIPVFASDWQKKVPEADRSATNPVASEPAAITAGGQTYQQKCEKCHGPNGEGKGHHPALRSQKMQDATPGEIHWIITHGTGMHGMPGFGKLSDSERWQLVSYIKSLQGASAGQSPNSK